MAQIPQSFYDDPKQAPQAEPPSPLTPSRPPAVPQSFYDTPQAPDPLGQKLAAQAPDRAARLLELNRKTGIPVPLISQNFEALDKRDKGESFDVRLLRRRAPEIARWLEANGEIAALAGDDLLALGDAEHSIQILGTLRSAWNSIEQFTGATAEAIGSFTGMQGLEDYGTEVRTRNAAEAAAGPKRLSLTHGDVQDAHGLAKWATEGLVSNLPQIGISWGSVAAGAAIGSAVLPGVGTTIGALIGAIPSWVLSVGEIQSDVKAYDPNAEAGLGVFIGGSAVAALDSRLPFSIGKRLTVLLGRKAAERVVAKALLSPVRASMLVGTLKEGVHAFKSEFVTEAIQKAIADVTTTAVTGKPFDVKQTSLDMLEEGLLGGLVGGAVAGGTHVTVGHRADQKHADLVDQNQRAMQELGKALQASKAAQRAEQATSDMVQAAGDANGAAEIYLPIETFSEYWQKEGLLPELVADELTGVEGSLKAAQDANLPNLAVPIGRYATKIAGAAEQKHHAFFLEEFRTAPDQMNARESKAEAAKLEADLAALDEQGVDQDADPRLQIAADLLKKITDAGGSALEAKKYAAYIAVREVERARRRGVDPMALYTSRPINFRITDKAGRDIVVQSQAAAAPGVIDLPASRAAAGETREARRTRETAHRQVLEKAVVDAAQRLDPTVPVDYLTQEFRARLDMQQDAIAETLASGDDPIQLLRDIATYGGLSTAHGGDLANVTEGTSFGTISGVGGVFRGAGLSPDVMLQRLQQDGRYQHLADEHALLEAVNLASRADTAGSRGLVDELPGTAELAALGIDLNDKWWQQAPWAADPSLREDFGVDESPTDEGDDSFNVDELEQSEPTPEQRARAIALYYERVTPGAQSPVHMAKAMLEAGIALPSRTKGERLASNRLVDAFIEEAETPNGELEQRDDPAALARLAALPTDPEWGTAVIPFDKTDRRTAEAIYLAADWSGGKGGPEMVPIGDLVATQPTVLQRIVRQKLRTEGNFSIGVRYQGKVYLMDGHHRAVAAWAKGDPTVLVHVREANPAIVAEKLAQMEAAAARIRSGQSPIVNPQELEQREQRDRLVTRGGHLKRAPAEYRNGRLRVSTRVPPEGAAPADAVLETRLRTVLADGSDRGDAVARFAAAARKLPVLTDTERTLSDAEQLEAFIDRLAGNLAFLYNHPKVKPWRGRAAKWYRGAHKFAQRLAARRGITLEQAAAVIASLSPNTEWPINLDNAFRLADIFVWAHFNDPVFDDQVWAVYVDRQESSKGESSRGSDAHIDATVASDREAYYGKRWSEIDADGKAIVLESLNQIHNIRAYPNPLPEGVYFGPVITKGGDLASRRPNTVDQLAKAIAVLEDGSPASISEALGNGHKVRSFFNNIVNPDWRGPVTIDVHAVSAALLFPTSAEHPYALAVMGGTPALTHAGIHGLNPLVAEAYHRAARQVGIAPHFLQSVTWEAARNMFTAGKKAAKKAAKDAPAIEAPVAKWDTPFGRSIEAIWRDVRSGTLRDHAARQRIVAASGGIQSPGWVDASPRVPAHESGLPPTYAPKTGRRIDLADPAGVLARRTGGARGRGATDDRGGAQRASVGQRRRAKLDAVAARPTRGELEQRDYGQRAKPQGVEALDRLDDELATLTQQIRDESGVPGVYFDASMDVSGGVYLDAIMVPQSRQDEGIGSAMLRKLLAWADTKNLAVSLDAAPSPRKKAALARFYRRHGFIKNGTARYYDPSLAGSLVRPSKSERLAQRGLDRGELAQEGDQVAPPRLALPHGATVEAGAVFNEDFSADQHGGYYTTVRLPEGAGRILLIDPAKGLAFAEKYDAPPETVNEWRSFPAGYLFIDLSKVKVERQGDGRKLYEAAMAYAVQRGYRGLSSKTFARNHKSNALWDAMERDGTVRRRLGRGGKFDVVEHTGGEFYQLEGFYSRVQRAIESSKQGKATGHQWKGTIKNAGVNLEEAQALTIDTLDNDTTYTRAQLLERVAEHQIAIEVVTLSEEDGYTRADIDKRADAAYERALDEDVAKMLDEGDAGVYIEVEDVTDETDRDEGTESWNVAMRDSGTGRVLEDDTVDSEEAAEQLRDEWQERADRLRYEELRDIAAQRLDYDDFREEAERELDDERSEQRPKYTTYTEPGADVGSQREVFLRAMLPTFQFAGLSEEHNRALGAHYNGSTLAMQIDRANDPLHRLNELRAHFDMRVRAAEALPELTGKQAEILTRERAILAALEKLDEVADGDAAKLHFFRGWQDGHDDYAIDEPIVRLRFNTRTADGQTTLFLEEVQPPHADEFAKMPALFQAHWRELAFKWALRYAAVHRYDQIAWTTGAMQVQRYSLRKVADRIEYFPNRAGGQLVAYRRNSERAQGDPAEWKEVFGESDVTPDKLPQYIGKELAARLLAAPLENRAAYHIGKTQYLGGPANESHELSEAGLEVGGRGITRLYDEDYKRVVNKLVKKAGGKVETLDVPFGATAPTLRPLPTVTQLEDIVQAGREARERSGYPNVFDAVHLPAIEAGYGADTVLNTMQHNHVSFDEAMSRLRPAIREVLAKALGGAYTSQPRLHAVPGVVLSDAVTEHFTQDQALYHADKRDDGTVLRGGFNRYTRTIRLIAGQANLSTFLHESSHLFLEELVEDALAVPAGHQLRTDAETALKFAGFQGSLEEWAALISQADIPDHVRDAHEKWAEAFVEYLHEGKAPTPELQSLFSTFRAWLVAVYRVLTRSGQGIEVPADVRGVMDRLLASDEAIARAERERNLQPLITNPDTAGVNPLTFDAYQADMRAGAEEARKELDALVMADWRKTQSAEWKVRREAIEREVRTEANQTPAFVAQSVIRTGKMPDGSTPTFSDGSPLRLSKDALTREFGGEFVRALPRPALYTVTGGVQPAAVAQMVGFPSAQAMLEALTDAPRLNAWVAHETDKRMRDTYGEKMLDGISLEEAAKSAVLEQRRKVISRELEMLTAGMTQAAIPGTRRPGAMLPRTDVLRQRANQAVAAQRVRELHPAQYRAAAARASERAFEAFGKNDRQAAIDAKKQELFYLELYRAAREAQEQSEKIQRRMRQLETSGPLRGRLAKAGFLEHIDAALERYEFARVTNKQIQRRQSLRDYLAELAKKGVPTDHIPADVQDDARRINWRELTVEELRGVADGVEMLAHLGRLKDKLLKAQASRDLEQLQADLSASIEDQGPKVKERSLEPRHPDEKGKRSRSGWVLNHRTLSSLIFEMDGFKHGGPMWQYVMRPLNEALDHKASMMADATKNFVTLLNTHYSGSEQLAMPKKTWIAKLGRADQPSANLSKMATLMVALNYGNSTNRQRMRDGYGWTEDQVTAILDTLDQRDWQWVVGVWQAIDSYWPETEAKMKRISGVAAPKVEAEPFLNRFGDTMPGGYFPIMFEGAHSPIAAAHENAGVGILHQNTAYMATTVKRNHEQQRAEGNVERAVRLDFGVITEHLNQVIHAIALHETIIDVGRILHADGELADTIVRVHGDKAYETIRKALQFVAVGEQQEYKDVDRWIDHLRRGSQVVGLGLNFTTPLLQIAGLGNIMARVGAGRTLRAALRVVGDLGRGGKTLKAIRAESEFMRNRPRTINREIHEFSQRVGLNQNQFEVGLDSVTRAVFRNKKTYSDVQRSFFSMITGMQSLVDAIAYVAARDQAVREGHDDETARKIGDQVVRDTQASGESAYQAEVLRGSAWQKLFTTFFGPMLATYNLWTEQMHKSRRDVGKGGSKVKAGGELVAQYVFLFVVGPAIITALRELSKGDAGDDDDVDHLLWEMATAMGGTTLLFRDAVQAAGSFAGYEGPPGLRPIATAGDTAKRVYGAWNDQDYEALTTEGLRGAFTIGGAMLHLPTGAAMRAWRAYDAWQEGELDVNVIQAMLFGYDREGYGE